MTATTATPAAPARPARPAAGGGTLTGTGTLVRFALRRDRVKLPAWLLVLTVLVFYYAAALPEVLGDNVQAFGRFMVGPVGALLGGPGYGSDAVTVEIAIVGVYGLYFLIAAALMNILLVARHTRVEEQTGRSELVRASVVGRHAPLTAALVVAAGANVLLALLIGTAMAVSFPHPGQGFLFGASVGALGLVFAGVAAVTAQVSEYSRAASGIAGAVLGAAYVVRAAGDMLGGEAHGSALSWFSPLAWSQQTRPYVDGRWWPLLLSVAAAAGAAAVGYALSARRDVGAGLVAARRGRAAAAAWLSSPLAYAFRLHRASLLWWAAALVVAGVAYGALTQPIVDAFADAGTSELIAVLGGDVSQLLDGYLGAMVLFDALLVSVFVVLGGHAVRAEESRGRAEPVLATAVSRWAWLGGHLAVLAAGAVGLLLVVGVVMGAASAASVGEAGYVADLVVAHLAYAPAVLVLLGVAALLAGVAPRAVGLAWVAFVYGGFIGFFGPLMGPPQWVFNLSPYEHVARVPLEDLTWPPLLVLTAVAAGLVAAGLAGFRRRDLGTT
ncbi:MAG TPA: ABC transporter permease [Natronosporangium sp.]|nr:ABC transporter permease [Natronosporangium sp.]